ncbi:hypothetical protein [Tenacibaculum jejuense]|uniref:HEAT repeat domain-containing protein n=1 Tax=Tenacibaculum jejuense TaxID=584609 RepID=A0A238UBM3_9FLAO|nr:hypothetical protein [Tenacibaculum jejuense]SNR16561.1 protein of unknown function [Tenacibaculum jejuense]
MTIEELKKVLREGSDKDKHKVISNVKKELLNQEIFNVLIELLEDSKYLNRFFAIYHLIDKFSDFLKNSNESIVNNVFNLLFDDFYPVVDRANWALSIIGDKALDKLTKEYYIATDENKTRIIIAVGRGNFSHRSKDRLHILLDGIKSENKQLRFNSMREIIANTQQKSINEWDSISDTSIDLDEIHMKILLIAKEFTNSEDDYVKNFSSEYLSRVGN